MHVRRLTDNPVPFWSVAIRVAKNSFRPPFGERELFEKLGMRLLGSAFRAVGIECLQRILHKGIDVEPTDAVIFTDYFFDKAWEYGGWPKVMLVLEHSKLQRTYCEIPATIAPDELSKLRERYPAMVRSIDGTKLWSSRLREDDPKITTSYETTYARWIQGNPFDVLKAIIVFVDPDDQEQLVKAVKNL